LGNGTVNQLYQSITPRRQTRIMGDHDKRCAAFCMDAAHQMEHLG
jgi:hypothetical protein